MTMTDAEVAAAAAFKRQHPEGGKALLAKLVRPTLRPAGKERPAPKRKRVNSVGTQSTRMRKLVADCGYAVRTTRLHIAVGLPSCPHGHELKEVTE